MYTVMFNTILVLKITPKVVLFSILTTLKSHKNDFPDSLKIKSRMINK